MSYNSDDSYGGNNRGGRRHGDDSDQFRRNWDAGGDGYADTGGYGPDVQDNRDDFNSSGWPDGTAGHHGLASQGKHHPGHGRNRVGSGVGTVNFTEEGDSHRSGDLYGGESATFGGDEEIPQARPSRNTEFTTGGSYGRQGGNQAHHPQQQQQPHYSSGENKGPHQTDLHGRNHVGSGVGTVNFTEEGDSRRTGDLYGGESATFGGDEETPQVRPNRNTESTTGRYERQERQGEERRHQQQQQQPHHQSGGENTHGRNHVGSGVGTVNFTEEGDSRRSGDLYGGESGTFGGGESSSTGGEYDVSSGGKYTPGAKVVLHAAEKETEKNPYNDVATGLAGETQNLVKQELKSLGGKFLESLTGGKH